jgi:hypothetical protein
VKRDFSEVPFTADEIEATKRGAIVVRHNPTDPQTKVRAVLEGLCIALNIPMFTEEQISAMLAEAQKD